MVEIPIIDIGPLVSNSPDAGAVAATIGRACRETGFFYVVGHGVAPETVETVFAMSRAFFAQPLAAKQKAAFSGPSGNRGWIKLGNEVLDPGKPHDLKEAFNIGLELAARRSRGGGGTGRSAASIAGPTFRDSAPRRSPISTPAGASGARCTAPSRSTSASRPISSRASSPGRWRPLRMLHYPPAPAEVLAGQLGAGEHTDYGNVTLLATDEVAGLMVRHRSGEWIAAPSVPNAFVCNIGDCLMRWTNDIYVSTPHKVVSPPGRHRYSIAFFLDPNPEAIVECLPTCIEPGRPGQIPAGHRPRNSSIRGWRRPTRMRSASGALSGGITRRP